MTPASPHDSAMTTAESQRWHYLQHAAIVAGFSLPIALLYGVVSGLFAARALRILKSAPAASSLATA